MPRSQTVDLRYRADISGLRKELAKMPGVSAAEAKKMVSSLDRQLKRAEKASKRAAKRQKDAWAAMGKAGIAAGAVAAAAMVAAGKAVVDLSQDVADLRNNFSDMSTRTGLSVSTLEGLQLAAEGSGLAYEDLAGIAAKLPLVMTQASQGLKTQQRAFADLGVSVTDANGSLRGSDEVLKETLIAISRLESPTQRAAAATQLFGKQGSKLLQALGDGSNLQGFIDLAGQFSVMGEGAGESAAEWQRNMALLGAVMRSVKADLVDLGNSSGSMLIPVIRAVVSVVAGAEQKFKDLGEEARHYAAAFGAVAHGNLTLASNELLAAQIVQEQTFANQVAASDEALERLDANMVKIKASAKDLPPMDFGAPSGGPRAEANIAKVAQATKRLQEITDAANRSALGGEAALNAEYQRRLDKIKDLEALSGDHAAADAARQAIEEEHLGDLALLHQQQREAQAQAEQEAHDKIEALRDEAHEKEMARVAQEQRARAALVASIAGGLGELAEATKRKAEKESKTNREAAKADWTVYQRLAESQAIVSGFAGAARAMKDYMYPYSLGIAALALASAGGQVAAIESQQPAFDIGGIVGSQAPDQVPARLLPGEGVVSRQGMAHLGTENLNEINRGQTPVTTTGITVTTFQHWDKFARDATRRGVLASAIQSRYTSPARGW